MTATDTAARMSSARPERTAAIMAETGLEADVLTALLHRFHDTRRGDPASGPTVALRYADRAPHPERLVAFRFSVALSSGRHHGPAVPARTPSPIEAGRRGAAGADHPGAAPALARCP